MRRWGCFEALHARVPGRLSEALCTGWLLSVSLGDGVLAWMPRDVRRPCPWGVRGASCHRGVPAGACGASASAMALCLVAGLEGRSATTAIASTGGWP